MAAFKKILWTISQDFIEPFIPKNITVMTAFAEAGLVIINDEIMGLHQLLYLVTLSLLHYMRCTKALKKWLMRCLH